MRVSHARDVRHFFLRIFEAIFRAQVFCTVMVYFMYLRFEISSYFHFSFCGGVFVSHVVVPAHFPIFPDISDTSRPSVPTVTRRHQRIEDTHVG